MPKSKYHRILAHNLKRHQAVAEVVVENVEAGEWPAIVFVREVAHGRELAQVLSTALGVEVPVVTSKNGEREALAARMREREAGLPVAVATDTWSTGIDIPCLMAAYQAGGGSAPIGLRQRAGRPLRAHGGKTFKFYDVVDVTDEGSFMEHNEKRVKHYERAGFKVDDKELLQQILTPMPKKKQPPMEPAADAPPKTWYAGAPKREATEPSTLYMFWAIVRPWMPLGILLVIVAEIAECGGCL